MSLTPNDDIFSNDSTPKTLETEKQRLRDSQENEYGDPDNIFAEITIPTTGKVGDDCVVKFSKKVPFAQLVISQDIRWVREDLGLGRKGDPKLSCRGFIIFESKDCDEISHPWEDIGYQYEKAVNLLLPGEYMIEARCYSNEAFEETTSRRLITITD